MRNISFTTSPCSEKSYLPTNLAPISTRRRRHCLTCVHHQISPGMTSSDEIPGRGADHHRAPTNGRVASSSERRRVVCLCAPRTSSRLRKVDECRRKRDGKDARGHVCREPEGATRRVNGAGQVPVESRIEASDRSRVKNITDRVAIAPSLSSGFDCLSDLQEQLS
jgi:hypothetical protein